jgi:5'-nucleotidase / UDP-sugar diphosphatase
VIHPGNRVVNITIGGAPLTDAGTYTVLVNSFLAKGGDGYAIFSDAMNATGTTIYDTDPVAAYIAERSPVAPVVEGRITIVNTT